ncbi:MAG2-interacting protein 2 isoform X3 [Phalaenopsis equestris]|uniref:MAG2-interacting protein 2 isoform X3 n=2 Tax=Phalaenopsis equestris TaxID=78828 RepID=UPI0009E2C702|nr:MAG2-interacting protein 2 isoform X3 [Phalaenopsis equestris]
MESGRAEVVEEVIFETRKHAAGVFAQDSSLQEVLNDSNRNGMNIGDQLVILQKDDDYMEPCGVYNGNDRSSFFTNGAWMEPQGILGVINDTYTFYLINSNGKEIMRSSRNELKLHVPIIDLVVLDNGKSQKSYMNAFGIFTADGLVHSFEVSEEPRASIFPIPILNNPFKDKMPCNISCLDYCPDLSLIVLVDAFKASEKSQCISGLYSLYLLRMATNLDLELVFCSAQFEGLFSSPKDHQISLKSSKVSISPQGEFIATLDLTGCIDVFRIDSDTISVLCVSERQHSQCFDKVKQKDIIDICWWTDHVLILLNSRGYFTMFDVINNNTILKEGPHFCMPVIERLKYIQGHVFVLEVRSSVGRLSEPEQTASKKALCINQLNNSKLHWSLLSISGRSATEMYSVLIRKQQYHSALEFADRHGLDRDEVFKAQWLSSCYGIQDVDMFLSKVSDRMFALSECVDKVGPTEGAVKALLSYGIHITEDYIFSNFNNEESCLLWDFWVARLQLLQYKDKLDTFVGINMGRFSPKEYSNFRAVPVANVAVNLAENGKIGALNLLFKRHPYSLSEDMLHILSAIPETVPVQSYSQLLPGKSPPATVSLRESDWVECERMMCLIDKMPDGSEKLIQARTENILKLAGGFVWPSSAKLVDWYANRAKDIDSLSGQLENCLALVEFACHKDILELQLFLEDITYLHHLSYADGSSEDLRMGLVEWEQLPDYEKFKMLLKGFTVDSVVETLQEKAIPFMQKRFHSEQVDSIEQKNDVIGFVRCEQSDSFLVRWMKEIASGNRLDTCLKVIENGCQETPVSVCGLFKDENEAAETALECIYLCTLTDQWNVMASILSKLPRKSLREKTLKDITPKYDNLGSGTPRFSYIRSHLSKSVRQPNPLNLHEEDSGQHNSGGMGQVISSMVDEKLEKRIKTAEGHVEVGRLLAYYQVAKPISFFLSAESEEKNVKQLLRLILSKFGRRQPGRSDSEWANMWQDIQCFKEKAFSFLDTEYMLIEFCRGLLKAGKFSLARNYLKGTVAISLATEKAEILVVQVAREYFFSASSLSCSEIWKARECLSLFPNSKVVQSEVDVIEALTVRLPNLGVTLLPVQFRQIRNPMEIINMAISNKTGAYLNVEELLEVAKLLGLGSPDDVAAVEEAIAREAAIAGDWQLASDLCLALANKGHGPIWDLCAAIARSPHLDTMDTGSRKQLLGFALSYCDEESIGELLHTWKDVDMLMHYEHRMISTGTCPPNYSFQGSKIVSLPVSSLQDIVNLRDESETINNASNEDEDKDKVFFERVKSILSGVAEECSTDGGINWDSLLRENRKVLSFFALELPWLLQLSCKQEYGRKLTTGAKSPPGKHSISIRFQALIDILHWLAENDVAPTDNLLISIVKSIMVSPVTEEDDFLGCSYLLNLFDAFHGVEVIEEQLKQREGYQEIYSIMNVGMSYSSIQNLHKESSCPDQRRKLLLQKFQEKYASFVSDEVKEIEKVHSTFWREWKTKLEDQKRLADQTRVLEETVPGVDTNRFLSGDIKYIRTVIFSVIDSVKTQKKHNLKEIVKLADTYSLQRSEVILRFFGSVLVSEQWGNDDILTEVSQYREDFANCAEGVIEIISTVVLPEINGRNKDRLSYVYSILSACHLRHSKLKKAALSSSHYHQLHKHVEPFQFYKVLAQECQKVSFIEELNFKNIARLDELNCDSFNEEILNNINESTVEALADMVRILVGMYGDTNGKGFISWQDVYKHHVLSLLTSLDDRTKETLHVKTPEDFQVLLGEIDQNFDHCKRYIRALPEVDILHVIKRFQKLCTPCNPLWNLTDDPGWKHCLVLVLYLWIKLEEGTQVTECCETSEKAAFSSEVSPPKFLKIFEKFVMEGQISASEGWRIVSNFAHQDEGGALTDIPSFFQSMIVSGCRFNSIANVYFDVHTLSSCYSKSGKQESLADLYASVTESVLTRVSYGFAEHRNLHRLLSSLSRIEGGHTDELMVIRSEVWGKLSAILDNTELESNIKVYALELMQCISGQFYKSLPAEIISEVEPWEDCEETCQSKTSTTAHGTDGSSNITTTLIALKSSRLITAVMPYIKITPEDLSSLDSAVTCFLNLCESATSADDADVLKAVLEDWEMLFSTTNEEQLENSPKDDNEWNYDDWDEGWETLPDDLINGGEKKKPSQSIRPLHSCWMEIIKMLVMHSRHRSVIELLDQRSSESDGILLDEDETKSLLHMMVEVDCFMALKILLLLPYDSPRLACFQVIESKLRGSGPPKSCDVNDYELLLLVLSSGVLQSITFDPTLGNFFSYICYLVGRLARGCQNDMLKYRDNNTGTPNLNTSLLFGQLLLPCFISELVQAKQCILAGFMVSQWMQAHPSLGLLDIVEVSLRKYLERQLLQADDSGNEDSGAFKSLQCAVFRLRGKLSSLLQSALSAVTSIV